MLTVKKLFPVSRQIPEALALAEEVFREFESPIFPPWGTDSFMRFLRGKRLRVSLLTGSGAVYICCIDGETAGMAAVTERYNKSRVHLSLAFVRGRFQRQGAGRALIEKIILDHPGKDISVNASPVGYEFYNAMGFVPEDMERMRDGLVFTPMIKKCS